MMRQTSRWQKSIAVTTGLSLAAMVVTTPSFAVNTNQLQGIQSSAPERTLLQNQGGYQLAQVSDSCRQVIARSGLYVRQEPTVYSRALGIIQYGRNVTVENRSTNNWARISAPLQGYVYASFLGPCETATPPPASNCRVVVATSGAPVRREPSSNAVSEGVVTYGRRVTIDNLGANGWVPITVPLRGYVQSAYLGYCR